MKIAIFGAGFSGMATAAHLLLESQASVRVDVFDPKPVGEGASGIASGLLHCFTGRQAKKAWMGDEGMAATHDLITQASKGAQTPIIQSKGILRPAVTEEQFKDFKATAEKYPDETEWWEGEIPGLEASGGLFIKTGLTLDAKAYLLGLKETCTRLGAQFFERMVMSDEVQTYDATIFAVGPHILRVEALQNLPITPIKGQLLELRWPQDLPRLSHSLISGGYLVMHPERDSCYAGATYEREFTDDAPNPEVAIPAILEKITPFFPSLKNAEVLNVYSGVRASSGKNHLPIVGRIAQRYWYITGMGSKGLLYHSLIGKAVAKALLQDDLSLLPEPCVTAPQS